MEEANNSKPTPSRLYCENDSCNKPRKHFCIDHSQVLCNGCFASLHVRCKCNEILDKKDVIEYLEIAKSLVSSIDQNSNEINARSYIKNFDEEFKMYAEKLKKIDENLTESIENDNFSKFSSIMDEVLQLQKIFIESSLFTEFIKFKQLKHIAVGGNISSQVRDRQRTRANSNYLSKFKEQVLKEMKENNKANIEQRAKEMSDKVISENQKIIDDTNNIIKKLEVKIQQEEERNKKLSDKNIVLTKEIKKQTEDFERERNKKIVGSFAEEEKKQREKEEQDRKDAENKVLKRLKDSSFLLNISDIPNFDFSISLTDAKQKDLFKDIETSNLRLPDIKRVRIDYVSDSDADLSIFLANCTPNQLKFICINSSATASTLIKSKIDINSLSKAVGAVTKEVYIRLYEFSAADLQQFIRAACNVERIIIQRCSVHCSSALDFGAKLKYNTKFLSFQACGYTGNKELTTDWKTDPSCFSYIVDAIGSSGLRHSLTKFGIKYNPTLEKAKLQELLNVKGMAHISVVEEFPDPSSE